MDESAEHVTSTDLLEISRLLIDQFRDVRRSQVEAAMWAMCVVVAEVGTEHLIEMSTAEDERPIEALRPNRFDPSLGEGVGFRGMDRGRDHLGTFGGEHFVEGAGSRSSDEKLGFRACWATQAVSGLVVAAVRCTLRVPISMKNKT